MRPEHLGVEAVHLAKPARIQSPAVLVLEGFRRQHFLFSFDSPCNLQICVEEGVLHSKGRGRYLSIMDVYYKKEKARASTWT